jgi:hypothetical protein
MVGERRSCTFSKNTGLAEGALIFAAQARQLACRKIGCIFDWEGGGAKWEAQPNSAHLKLYNMMDAKDEAIIEGVIEGNIIPMRSK